MAFKYNSRNQKGVDPTRSNKLPTNGDTNVPLVPGYLVKYITKGDQVPGEHTFIHPMKRRYNDAETGDKYAGNFLAPGLFSRRLNNSINDNVASLEFQKKSYPHARIFTKK